MYTKKADISSLREGDRVDDIFVVKIKKGVTPYANGFRFTLILSDATGKSIEYVYWGEKDENSVRQIYESIDKDGIVLVKGYFRIFNNKPQIYTNPPDTIRTLQKGEYDPSEFIKPSKRDISEMKAELVENIQKISNPDIRKLLERIFVDDEEFMETFSSCPGAIEIHHNWTGGLIQHTLEVASYCRLSKKLFPELDENIMIAGALLHDIGKTEEIAVTTRIKGTVKGQLKGHIAMGFRKVANIMDELGTPENIRNKILHIMLSHHGQNELGSPKEPMFPEAVAVYYADEMSSKISEIAEFIKDHKDATEDDFMYHRKHKRNIYLR